MDILTLSAILPGLFLIWYVYQQDKIEKEPFDLLKELFLLGAAGVFVASFVEGVLVSVLKLLVNEKSLLGLVLQNFLGVALVEEFIKHKVLQKTWNHPAFDYRFDAMVYAVVVGMGFAILENIFYVWQHGFQVAVMRAVFSLPGHCIFAVYMGYYFGEAKVCETCGDLKGKQNFFKLSLLVPVLLHGFYDFCLAAGAEMFTFFILFTTLMDYKAYRKIKQYSSADRHL